MARACFMNAAAFAGGAVATPRVGGFIERRHIINLAA
jgi:hypothetical protein